MKNNDDVEEEWLVTETPSSSALQKRVEEIVWIPARTKALKAASQSIFLVLFLWLLNVLGLRTMSISLVATDSWSDFPNVISPSVLSSAPGIETSLPDSKTQEPPPDDLEEDDRLRVLYIITSATEFNNGRRKTVRGEDRYQLLVVPTVARSVRSMVFEGGFDVDVYLVLAYSLNEERIDLLRKVLPESVNLTVWNDAVPLWYEPSKKPKDQLLPIGRALARQHRYVVKDQFFKYDFFAAFEDDMHVTGQHIRRYLEVQKEFSKMMQTAPSSGRPKQQQQQQQQQQFYGPLTKSQLQRMRPGFMRTEIRLDNTTSFPAQKLAAHVPTDYSVGTDAGGSDNNNSTVAADPSYCCETSQSTARNETVALTSTNDSRWHPPKEISSNDLLIWETSIEALEVLELPNGQWVVLLPGCPERRDPQSALFGFWSGNGISELEKEGRRIPVRGVHMAQSAGWMATREEILDYHTDLCGGHAFLPPFDGHDFASDGLLYHNVEFWSGGLQLFCRHCSIQRVIPIDNPIMFSKHLMYHTSNNKQSQVPGRTIHANILLGQLNGVKKAAMKTKEGGL